LLEPDQAALERDGNGFRAVVYAEFLEQGFHVGLDRFLGNKHGGGDLFVSPATGNEAEHVELARREPGSDHPVGEARRDGLRQEALALVDLADGGDDFLLGGVLEQIAAGTGFERLTSSLMVWMPSPSGMRKSTMSTSAGWSVSFSNTSRPVPASATTWKSGWLSRMLARPARSDG